MVLSHQRLRRRAASLEETANPRRIDSNANAGRATDRVKKHARRNNPEPIAQRRKSNPLAKRMWHEKLLAANDHRYLRSKIAKSLRR